ncbi:MAG: MgtC/SapB family protein [Tabrizicola sp.]|jgi:putative Mg2+ transporter-C (MgtC) family protein|uniref:MgtC/SapB family protein n=1 Tax=Tabrizicola sp. TaxID=2005166 RepID=UPI001B645769|nr:MgtC/SapB family protein [Tabrizicola sp.]MCC6518893.1 MgtC/SapB family protein [Tabrizicola sp.]
MELFRTWNTDAALAHLVALAVAYVLALPIGWNREREERSAGLRTFPLVAMAACGFVMIATEVLGADSQQHSRILEGLMTGMGFVGGGAILKQGDRAKGTATAASLWATGAIGAAVGYGQLDIAVILSLVTVLTLVLMAPLRKVVQDRSDLDRDEV